MRRALAFTLLWACSARPPAPVANTGSTPAPSPAPATIRLEGAPFDAEAADTDTRRRTRRRSGNPVPITAAVAGALAPACLDRAQLGDLAICTTAYEAPSHGGEESILVAHAIVDNRGASPVQLDLIDAGIVDEAGTSTGMSDLAWSIDAFRGGRSATIPPGGHVELTIDGHAKLTGFRYHVHYHHNIELRAANGAAMLRAGDLYFRYPHRR